jgi:uncharacterized protein YecE (DUF72 family)
MNRTKLYFGTAGWSYKDWNGIVYPPKVDPLEYLSHYVDTIEINSSFYRIPYPNFSTTWVRKVSHNPNFKFTAKLNQIFTHERKYTKQEVTDFIKGFAPMLNANKLGTILIQFPWSFKCTPENQTYLEKLVANFTDFVLTIEVRHSSWNNSHFYNWLIEHQIGFCNIDQPLFYNSIAPSNIETTKIGYIRLHGRNYENWFKQSADQFQRYDYLYSEEELIPWAEKIQELAKKVKELYVIANNHFKGQALVNTLQLNSMVTKSNPKIPELLQKTYPNSLNY